MTFFEWENEELKKELNTIFIIEDYDLADMIIEIVERHITYKRIHKDILSEELKDHYKKKK